MEFRIRELGLLLVGDVLFLTLSLWATLTVRYLSFPSQEIFEQHLVPFSVLIVIWLFVFFIAGLYDKHTAILKRRLFGLIINVQLFNIIAAALFFFTAPGITIAPKTNLVIYLFISSALILFWRLHLFSLFAPKKRRKALLIAEGVEAEELVKEINTNSRYNFSIVRIIDEDLASTTDDFEVKMLEVIKAEGISVLIADTKGEHVKKFLPKIFNTTFLKGKLIFFDFHKVYEDIFDRIPVSYLEYDWFLENIPQTSRLVYDIFKRIIDVVGSLILGVFVLALLPVIALALKLEDGGSIFVRQERIGRLNSRMHVYKFRTMRYSDRGAWKGENKENIVTRVGAVLRKTSLDEFPQLLNILKGEMSLIGPRNDIADLGARLEREIPYYNIRYFITPGITGWAQTHQLYAPGEISPQSIEESRLRLAYDLYYIKHRSFFLDISIALRTLKTMLGRFGITIRLR